MAYLVLWEFTPHADLRRDFEQAYGPGGEWARLFETDTAFLGTELWRDAQDPSRYLTLDRWASRQAYEDFLRRHQAEYRAVDFRCERLTLREAPLGTFELPES